MGYHSAYYYRHRHCGRWDSSLVIVTRLRAAQTRNCSIILARVGDLLLIKTSGWLWDPSSHVFAGHRGSFVGVKRSEREVDHSPHLVSRLRMSGAMRLLSIMSHGVMLN